MNNIFKKMTALIASLVCMLTFVGLGSHDTVEVANAAESNLVQMNEAKNVRLKDYDFNIATYASDNSWTDATKYTKITSSDSKVTITAVGDGNTGKYYKSNFSWRFYNGAVIEIESTLNIKTVAITYNTEKGTFGGVANNTPKTVNSTYAKYSASARTDVLGIKVVCEEPIISYSVTFNTGDPALSVPTQTIEEGKKVTQPDSSNLIRDGYVFDGWIDDATGLPFNFTQTTVTKAISLTAKWIDASLPRIDIEKDTTEVIKGTPVTLSASYVNATEDKVNWSIVEGTENGSLDMGTLETVEGMSMININALNKGTVTVKAEITVNGQSYSDKIILNTYNNEVEKEQLIARNMLGITYSSAEAKSFVKVSKPVDDYSGKYLIVCETENVALASSLLDIDVANNNRAVTISNGEIIKTTELMQEIVTIEKNKNGTYSIQLTNGKYIGSGGSKNDLLDSKKYENNISINQAGNAVIKIGDCSIKYNNASNQNRFRYYKSSSTQNDIQLYKLDAGISNFSDVRARLEIKMSPNAFLMGDEFGVYVGTTPDKQGRIAIPETNIIDNTTDVSYVFSVTGLNTTEKYNQELYVTPFIKVDGTDYKFTTYVYSAHSIAKEYIDGDLAPEYTELLKTLETTFNPTVVEGA